MPDGIIIAAGSEVALALQARELLFDDGIDVRVVSMPSTNLFDEQPKAYRDAVLPPQVTRRLAVEMGASQSWYKYVGLNGKVMDVDRFGISGPGAEVVKALGFTPEHIFREYKHLNKTNYLAVKTPVIQ